RRSPDSSAATRRATGRTRGELNVVTTSDIGAGHLAASGRVRIDAGDPADDDTMTEFMPPVLYLGPRLSRWQPRTLDDVRTVLHDGLLAEGHWLDAKREIGTSKTSKKELARDLASFANDGGALLIGIAEDKDTGTF